MSEALANKQITVAEAIDLAAATAHAVAREAGVQDNVIAVVKPPGEEEA